MKANIVKGAEAKKYYVYELINMTGTVEYVGESSQLQIRYNQHTKSKCGKFYNRQDIMMNIVTYFYSKKEAFDYQCQLQKEYGLITDTQKNGNANRGKKFSDEIKLKMRLAKLGKKHSMESILNMSKPKSIQAKLNMSKAHIGEVRSTEYKLKMSEALKLYYHNKRINKD